MASSRPAAAPITLEQLLALNDEIAALVRVGVPLEQGLRALGSDLPGGLGDAAQVLADGMDRGQTLSEVLAQNPRTFPPVYRAVVEAGLKSGQLAIALEALAGAGRRLLDARRIVLAGLIYPILVFLVAWVLFVFFVLRIAPVFVSVFADIHVPGRAFLANLAGLGDSVQYWGPAVPLAVLLLAAVWAFLTGRATAVEPRMAGVLLGWLPWTGRMLAAFRVAMFSDVLALLVENCVPLPKAIVLAAEAVGNAAMVRSARQMAEAIERGDRLGGQTPGMDTVPPLLHWLMVTGQNRGTLVAALRHASETYHRRAQRAAEAARLLMPVLLTLGIGGTVTAAYALVVFGSWVSILRSLAGI